ncbi:hypothetical protein [Geothrix alkalitolerans]|uniref:hypothetical protein n=1 Tax=Geothrix alkalitolerans TaxID=2922724 RepID=UPI001FAF7720|nr:hypothetical protein [Geothrix alkalitolerans]
MTSDQEEQNGRGIAHLISFGLAAAGLATIIQLATLPKLDHSLLVTVYGFAFAIPVLVTSGLAVHPATEVNLGQSNFKFLLFVLYYFGTLAFVVAVGGLFFHFSFISGMAYVAATLICAVVARRIETGH